MEYFISSFSWFISDVTVCCTYNMGGRPFSCPSLVTSYIFGCSVGVISCHDANEPVEGLGRILSLHAKRKKSN